MYCKNCGKKLPDDARFCDRCNQSVRKQDDKAEQLAQLKAEREARKRAKEIERRLKNIKKIKRKRKAVILCIAAGVLLAGIVSGIFAYTTYLDNSGYDEPINDVSVITETPETTAAPTASVSPSEVPDVYNGGGSAAVSINPDGYAEANIGDMKFLYPNEYRRVQNDSEILLEVSDGSSTIRANRAVTSKAPKDVMKVYSDGVNGKVISSLAGDSSYSITIDGGDVIHHRCGVVKTGIETYYEMRYPASGNAAQYEGYIAYMDEHLKNSIQ